MESLEETLNEVEKNRIQLCSAKYEDVEDRVLGMGLIEDDISGEYDLSDKGYCGLIVVGYERRGVRVPDLELRDMANKNLKDIYDNNKLRRARISAGKALGYSSVKIWSDEHPILTIAAGIVAAAMASGVIYAVFENSNR